MKRIAVIGITVAAIAALLGGLVAVGAITTSVDGDSVLIVAPKQAAECDSGGGCAILSLRQMELIRAIILSNARKQQGTGI